MKSRHLSPEIVSLIHHVELNESGWWKKAIGQVIKGVLWTATTPVTIEEVQSLLSREVGITLTGDVIERELQILLSQQTIAKIPNEKFKLTEATRSQLAVERDSAINEQALCQQSFFASCARHCPNLNSQNLWGHFQAVLIDAIHVTGANLFQLLSNGDLQQEVDWVKRFLSHYSSEYSEGLHQVLSEFFSPSNLACRNQVLRFLTAHFFAEASQLKPETLAIVEKKKRKRAIKVVLDTNFIFSILELHDNPGDDSAMSLVDIAKRKDKHLDIKLYVLPGTLDEAQRVLSHQLASIERVRASQALTRAALKQPLSSIAKKFFDVAAHTSGLTARSFFQPYIDDLRTILTSKEIFVLDSPAISERQQVIDDVSDELSREEQKVPEERRKGYHTLLHDVILWHTVNDRRPPLADTPFDVEYWVVSIDWRLISFDRKKRGQGVSRLPVVLHPNNLMQFIQFWVPRSKELEDSLIDSLRLPLFFQRFDPEDERATWQVLEAISRFENIDDFPEETVGSILANRALRARLKESDVPEDEVFELVREELLNEHKTAVINLNNSKVALLKTELLLNDEKALREEAAKNHQQALEEMAEAQQKLSEERRQTKDELIRIRFLLLFVLLPIALGIGVCFSAYHWFINSAAYLSRNVILVLTITAAMFPVALASFIAPFFTRHHETLKQWWMPRVFAFYKKIALGFLVLAIYAIFQTEVVELFKTVTGQ